MLLAMVYFVGGGGRLSGGPAGGGELSGGPAGAGGEAGGVLAGGGGGGLGVESHGKTKLLMQRSMFLLSI